uniref:Unc-45 myosin chaperone B n=1 Tax=Petromyzon marinus TaxID=7757 RepID=S4R4X4_PETMA
AVEDNESDVKALYRRCQAYEKMDRLDQAFRDAQRCSSIEPQNKVFVETLRKLSIQIQGKLKVNLSTDAKVEQMFKILFDENTPDGDKEKAAQNMVILARDAAGADSIYQSDGVRQLQRLISANNPSMVLAVMRTLVGLCTAHEARATAVLRAIGMETLCRVMASDDEGISIATCKVVQAVWESIVESLPKDHDKQQSLLLDSNKDLKGMVVRLVEMLVDQGVSGYGRDNAMNILIKIIPRKSLKNPDNSVALKFIDYGMKHVLKVAGIVAESPGGLAATENTCMTAAVLLNKLYEDLRSDAERENYEKICAEYVTKYFGVSDAAGNLHAIQTISGLLQGPFDVGNKILELKGVLETMVALVASERELDQLVATEALIYAAAKSNRATFITSNGVSLLKDIYKKTTNDKIKIRALVGLCKVGSAGGTDYSLRQFAEGSMEKLAKQCRKFLCSSTNRLRCSSRAVNASTPDLLCGSPGTSSVQTCFSNRPPPLPTQLYMGTVKKKTPIILLSILDVSKIHPYKKTRFGCCCKCSVKGTVNHVTSMHPKDKKKFVNIRVKKLLKAGLVSALVCMVKSDSAVLTDASKELMSRVFLALVEETENRGTIVAEGGGKALIPLALEGTEVGKSKAAQALAKITITANPVIAFPGERIYEVVRPLVSLLNVENSGLQNFESLMALTNLAGINDKLRKQMLKEKAFPMIESHMFEDHEQIRAAATECMCNMVLNKEVQEMFEADGNDRMKLLVLYSGMDDEKVQMAASGALAMLTTENTKLCAKATQVTSQWLEILQHLVMHEKKDLQVRGLAVTLNLMSAEKGIAEKLMESEMMEILSLIAKQEGSDSESQNVILARECLSKALNYGLIKPFSD